MNRVITYLFAFACFALVGINHAHAIGPGNDNPGTIGGDVTNVNTNLNSVSNRISNDVRSAAQAYAMSANANNSAGVSGGSQSGVDVNVVYPKQVAAVARGGLYPSAPCMGTSNVGGGNPFFNVAVGTSWESKECQVRETARSFAAIGLTQDAVAILCTSEYAAAAPSCPKPVAKE